MQLQVDTSASTDDYSVIERRISERTKRVSTLLDLDSVLSAAANRYNLAAEIVHYGWPHRAD
jgi:hypothetical protein